MSAAAAAPPAEGENALIGFSRQLWLHRWLIAGTTAGAIALAGAALLVVEPYYLAEAKIVVDPRQATPLGWDASGPPSIDAEAVQNEVQMLLSPALAVRAVRQLDLVHDPVFNRQLRPPSRPRQLAASLLDRLKAVLLRRPAAELSVEELTPEERATGEFIRRLRVTQVSRSRVIGVAFEGTSRRAAAEIVNAYVNLYLASRVDENVAAVAEVGTRLDQHIEAAQEDLRQAEAVVEAARRKLRLTSGADGTPASQQMEQFSAQLVLARTAQIQADARWREGQQLTGTGQIAAVGEVQRSPAVEQLRDQETEAARHVADLQQALGEKHPALLNARAELAAVQRRIDEEAARIVRGLKNEAAAAASQVGALEAAMAGLRREVGEENVAEVELHELERAASERRATLEALQGRARTAAEAQSLRPTDVKLLAAADPPRQAAFPMPGLFLAAGGLAGLSLGVFLSILLELLRNGYRTSQEVEADLGVPVLAVLPESRRRPDPLRRPGSAFVEGVRTLCAILYPRARGLSIPVFVIASARHGRHRAMAEGSEGATVGASVARAFATAGERVLVPLLRLASALAHGLRVLGASLSLPLGNVPATFPAAGPAQEAGGGPAVALARVLAMSGRRVLLCRAPSPFLEGMRSLSVALCLPARDLPAPVLAITSPQQGAGKTTLALTLARLLAMAGRRVLLVDGDLRRPGVASRLDLEVKVGLSEILAGRGKIEDAILGDAVQGLYVLPAGGKVEDPAALLGSPMTGDLLADLRRWFDLIIIDTPPILPVPDARILAQLADDVIVVLRWGRTGRAEARLSLEHLAEARARLGGVVISRAARGHHAGYLSSGAAGYAQGAAMRAAG